MVLRAIHIFLLAVGVAILSFLIAYMLIKQSYGYAFIFLVLDIETIKSGGITLINSGFTGS